MRLHKVNRRGQKLKHVLPLKSVGEYQLVSSIAIAVMTFWLIPPPWIVDTVSVDIA